MLDFLVSFFGTYGYAAVFACLVLCGLGVPVPEDITLVSGGVISGLDLANPHIIENMDYFRPSAIHFEQYVHLLI